MMNYASNFLLFPGNKGFFVYSFSLGAEPLSIVYNIIF